MAKSTKTGKKQPAKARGSPTTKLSSADAVIQNTLNRGRGGSRKVVFDKENNSHPKENVQPSPSDDESDSYESIDSRQIQYTQGNSNNSDVREDKKAERNKQLLEEQKRQQEKEQKLRAAVLQGLKNKGRIETNEGRKACLGQVCRHFIFCQIKFVQEKQMTVGSSLAERVRLKMEYAEDDLEYNKAWKQWKAKAVRRFVNKQRSACAQSMMRGVLKGTWEQMGEEAQRMAQEQPLVAEDSETSHTRTGGNSGAQSITSRGPSLQELEHLIKHKRKSYKYYIWFYRVVLPNVVGKQAWKGQQTTVVATTTASDTNEALALLILENLWMYWIHRFNNPHLKSVRRGGMQPLNDDQHQESEVNQQQDKEGAEGDDTQSKEAGRNKKEFVVRKLYMISGKKERGNGDQKGWSIEGLRRMNQLVLEVQKDQKEDRNQFDIAFRASMIREKWGKKTNRTDMQVMETVEVITGEWSD